MDSREPTDRGLLLGQFVLLTEFVNGDTREDALSVIHTVLSESGQLETSPLLADNNVMLVLKIYLEENSDLYENLFFLSKKNTLSTGDNTHPQTHGHSHTLTSLSL